MSQLTKVFDPITQKWVKKSALSPLLKPVIARAARPRIVKLRVINCAKCQVGNRIIEGQKCRICQKLGLINV